MNKLKFIKKSLYYILITAFGGLITLLLWEYYKSLGNFSILQIILIISLLLNIFFFVFILNTKLLGNYFQTRRLNKFKNKLLKFKPKFIINDYKYLFWFCANNTVRSGRYAFPYENGFTGFDAREIPELNKLISYNILKVIPDNVNNPLYYDLWLDTDIYDKLVEILKTLNEYNKDELLKLFLQCNLISYFRK